MLDLNSANMTRFVQVLCGDLWAASKLSRSDGDADPELFQPHPRWTLAKQV